MQDKGDFQGLSSLSQGELVIFWRHMAFRFFVCCWALYSIINDPVDKAFITLLVLVCAYAMGETIFASYMGFARLKARWDEGLKRQEERRKAKEAMAAAQAASAAKYFELEKEANSMPKPGASA